MLARNVLLRLADSKALGRFVRHNRYASRAAARFVAGETVASIVEPVKQLNAGGITATLDLLGESVAADSEVGAVVAAYKDLLAAIAEHHLDANVSLKLTSIGLDLDAHKCAANLESILQAAGANQFVRIDMEGSAYTQRTLDMFEAMWSSDPPFKNCGPVIQAYLRRSEADIEHLNSLGARVRLCKGAYNERPDVAFAEKAEVDQNYVRLMKMLLAHGTYPGIATHDPNMIAATKAYAEDSGIPKSGFEFQMLYGIRRDLQAEIAREGYRLRVYTPFGESWYPYMMRRLAERPANLWFAARNMLRG